MILFPFNYRYRVLSSLIDYKCILLRLFTFVLIIKE